MIATPHALGVSIALGETHGANGFSSAHPERFLRTVGCSGSHAAYKIRLTGSPANFSYLPSQGTASAASFARLTRQL